MTRLTPQEDYRLTSAIQIEADLAAGRRDAGMEPRSVEECRAELDEALTAMDANRNFDTRRNAEIARRAWSRALDELEQATRTGRFSPVSWPLSEA